MRVIKCRTCSFQATEADKQWDTAIAVGKCPECSEQLESTAVAGAKPQTIRRDLAVHSEYAVLWLFLLSVLIALSPALYAVIYYGLGRLGVITTPDPSGAGALSFLMLFTIPAGFVLFLVGLVTIGIMGLDKK